MTRKLLLHPTILSGAYAFFIVLMNWQYNSKITTEHSYSKIAFDGAAVAIILSLAATFYFGRIGYRQLRTLLNDGTRVPRSVKFIDWAPCLILIPLLFRFKYLDTQTSTSDGTTTMNWGDGSDLSFFAIITGILAIITFQISVKLSKIARKNHETAIPANPEGLQIVAGG